MEDEHEMAALRRLHDVGNGLGILLIGLVLFLAGVEAIPTWWVLVFAAVSIVWDSSLMVRHLRKSETALK